MLQDGDEFEVEVLPGNMPPCLPEQVSSGESGTINPTNSPDAGGVHRQSVALLFSRGPGPEIHNVKQLEILHLNFGSTQHSHLQTCSREHQLQFQSRADTSQNNRARPACCKT